MNVYRAGRLVKLTDDMLIAEGGEGRVFGTDTHCYKVYHDPARALPDGKFRELSELDRKDIVRPESLLTDDSGGTVGYVMRRIKNAQDLPPLFTRSFRERKHIKPETVFGLVLKLRDLVAYAHEKRCLIVDLNELNFLATRKLDGVYAIDVDSWQTASYPATAIMETVRDRHAPKRGGRWVWNSGTDWFAFAVLASQLLIGIHPYRGRHPDCHHADPAERLEERMRRNLSVFNARTVLPPPCFPIADVPTAYRNWFVAVLERGERLPAPATGDAPTVVAVPAAPAPVAAQNALRFVEVLTLPAGERATVVRSTPAAIYVLAASGRVYGGHSGAASYLAQVPGGDDHDLALTGDGRLLVVRYDPSTEESVVSFPDGTELDRRAGRPVVTADGRVTVLHRSHVLELSWLAGVRPVAGPKIVANVLAGSATLYPGVVVQRLVDAWYATAIAADGSYQVRLPEVANRRVVDARYEGRVLVVVVVDSKSGRYDELTYLFDESHTGRQVRETCGVTYAGIAFVTLPGKGVLVQIGTDGTVDACRLSTGVAHPTVYQAGSRIGPAAPVGRRGDDVLIADGGVVSHMTIGQP